MNAKGVLETCIYARDLDAAERFYRDVLGLKFHAREPGRHVFFRCGDAMFLIFNPEKTIQPGPMGNHGSSGPVHAAFRMETNEVEAWRSHLAVNKVAIEQDHHWPNGARSLYFRDPAGNSIELATSDTWA